MKTQTKIQLGMIITLIIFFFLGVSNHFYLAITSMIIGGLYIAFQVKRLEKELAQNHQNVTEGKK